MKNIDAINFLESVIRLLSDIGKSKDVSSLLFEMDINKEDGLLNDFVTELGLTASPNEEVGVGCFSINHIEKALAEVRDTGTTTLLESDRA